MRRGSGEVYGAAGGRSTTVPSRDLSPTAVGQSEPSTAASCSPGGVSRPSTISGAMPCRRAQLEGNHSVATARQCTPLRMSTGAPGAVSKQNEPRPSDPMTGAGTHHGLGAP